MFALTVLSPHQDDAVFSLCIALGRWRSFSVKIRVVNIFTISAYAPQTIGTDRAAISLLRKREDRRALHEIDPGIAINSCDFVDAPLRLNINIDWVCKPQLVPKTKTHFEAIVRSTHKYFEEGLVLAPLGLGDHVDHALVRDAAASQASHRNLGFYEDLPYAIWTSEAALAERVGVVEEMTRAKLKPMVIRSTGGIQTKRRIVNKYQSQITPEEATAIACFAGRYQSGERVWVPTRAAAWNFIDR